MDNDIKKELQELKSSINELNTTIKDMTGVLSEIEELQPKTLDALYDIKNKLVEITRK